MTLAEDVVSAREARVQEEIDRKVAETHAGLAKGYNLKLELQRAEADGRTGTLRAKLEEAEQRESSAATAQSSA